MGNEEWAKQLAQKKIRDREKHDEQTDKERATQRLLNTRAPELWLSFRKEAQRNVNLLNEAMGGEQVLGFAGAANHNKIALKNTNGGDLFSATYDHAEHSLTFMDGTAYVAVPHGGDNVVWKLEGGSGERLASDELAERVVGKAFEVAS